MAAVDKDFSYGYSI